MKTMLKQIGIKEEPLLIERFAGGANNRVYRLKFQKRAPLVCKHYFQHVDDRRPRLQTEYAFLSYAWKNGIRRIPKPLICDQATRQALYSFIPGKPPEQVTEDMVNQSLRFFLNLNKNKKAGKNLPFASEHCLTIKDYISTVEHKLAQCRSISDSTSFHRDVKYFIQNKLIPRWKQILKKVTSTSDQIVEKEDLCITPSDFGFHNALLDLNALYFLDFEYAGWDDPAKTACDFFCQPKIPVPLKFFEKVTTAIAATTRNPEMYLKRIQTLFPTCQIKWCCIILNVFQKTGSERRRFADPDLLEKLDNQFILAKHYFERLNDGIH